VLVAEGQLFTNVWTVGATKNQLVPKEVDLQSNEERQEIANSVHFVIYVAVSARDFKGDVTWHLKIAAHANQSGVTGDDDNR